LLEATCVSLWLLAAANFFVQLPISPRRLILDGIMTLMVLGAVRATWRMSREIFRPIFDSEDCRWALMVGTDLSAGILAHQIQSHFRWPYRIRGLLATDEARKDARLGQIPILGSLADVRKSPPSIASRISWWLPARCRAHAPRLMQACEQGKLT